MSKREKNLIFIMLVMLICFGGFKYFLEPAISRKTALNMEATTLVVDMAAAKDQLDNVAVAELAYEESLVKLANLADQVQPYRQDEVLETMFLDVAKNNNLYLKSFEMEERESADHATVEEAGGLVLSVVTGKNFTISMAGDYTSFTGVIHDLLPMEDVAIHNLSYGYQDEEWVLVVQGTVFMANK